MSDLPIVLRERAAKLRAEIRIYSKPLTGSEIDLRVPANVAYKAWHDPTNLMAAIVAESLA